MPREVVTFDSNRPNYECAAQFFATVAYPADLDRRESFYNSLCRDWLSRSPIEDREPDSREYVLVRRALLRMTERECLKPLRKGLDIVYRRFCVGHYLVLPKFKSQVASAKKTQTITALLENVMMELSWRDPEGNSLSTAKTRIWKPCWPVLHACGAFAAMNNSKEGITMPVVAKGLVYRFMYDEITFNWLLILAECIRLWTIKTKTFKHAVEGTMIQFIKLSPNGSPIEYFGSELEHAPAGISLEPGIYLPE